MNFLKKYRIHALIKKIKSMQQSRIHNPATDEMLVKERNLYFQLAKLYDSLQGNKKFPFASLLKWEAIRAAAAIEDAEARYQLGKYLIDMGKCRTQLQEEGAFANVSNERQARQLFDEGLAYLQAAEDLNHVLARRLHGLCYINGWGVAVDKEKGFDLVIDSIDQENSWEQAPQIFADIGLNQQEFFAAQAKRRRLAGKAE